MNMMLILLLCFIIMQSLGSGKSIIDYMNVTYMYTYIIIMSYWCLIWALVLIHFCA